MADQVTKQRNLFLCPLSKISFTGNNSGMTARKCAMEGAKSLAFFIIYIHHVYRSWPQLAQSLTVASSLLKEQFIR